MKSSCHRNFFFTFSSFGGSLIKRVINDQFVLFAYGEDEILCTKYSVSAARYADQAHQRRQYQT